MSDSCYTDSRAALYYSATSRKARGRKQVRPQITHTAQKRGREVRPITLLISMHSRSQDACDAPKIDRSKLSMEAAADFHEQHALSLHECQAHCPVQPIHQWLQEHELLVVELFPWAEEHSFTRGAAFNTRGPLQGVQLPYPFGSLFKRRAQSLHGSIRWFAGKEKSL